MLIYTLQQELTSTEEQHNDLQVIFKEIERMERFVRDFLEFARPPDPKPGHFDLQATIQDTLTLLAPRLRQQHIRVFQDHAPRAQHLYADADQIKQVLMNLMLNALEFMPAGGQLRLTTRVQEGKEPETSKRWAQILLCDTGSGIPPELLENLFDPFVSGREEGVGLGLSIAHQIVHRHGGWIEALNNAEGGATFVITLPAGELGEYARAS